MTDHDFGDEEPTRPGRESMSEIMQSLLEEAAEEMTETVRAPGIVTPTSERPTRPIRVLRRPPVINNYENP